LHNTSLAVHVLSTLQTESVTLSISIGSIGISEVSFELSGTRWCRLGPGIVFWKIDCSFSSFSFQGDMNANFLEEVSLSACVPLHAAKSKKAEIIGE